MKIPRDYCTYNVLPNRAPHIATTHLYTRSHVIYNSLPCQFSMLTGHGHGFKRKSSPTNPLSFALTGTIIVPHVNACHTVSHGETTFVGHARECNKHNDPASKCRGSGAPSAHPTKPIGKGKDPRHGPKNWPKKNKKWGQGK